MDKKMEIEIYNTISILRNMMISNKKNSFLKLFLIAVSEIDFSYCLITSFSVVMFGCLAVKLLLSPMLVLFCVSPITVLTLYHKHLILECKSLGELEGTLKYSYNTMLGVRILILTGYSFIVLLILSVLVNVQAKIGILRLLLCGVVPNVYLSLIIVVVSYFYRKTEDLTMIISVLWVVLSFLLNYFYFGKILNYASNLCFFVICIIGIISLYISVVSISKRRKEYAYIVR